MRENHRVGVDSAVGRKSCMTADKSVGTHGNAVTDSYIMSNDGKALDQQVVSKGNR